MKKLAESHGGAVGVRSVSGQGSTLWFDLPVAGVPDVVPDRAEQGFGDTPALGST